tara:strand:+ start:265 stop:813 length:549 start_codon:yes stop_codon:yes gene_type:complete
VILDHLNTSSQKAALIPQELGLVENLSVYHNVYIGRLDQYSTFSNLLNLVTPKHHARIIVQSILNTLSLGDKLLVPCGELSGGQQQRVAIAGAIFRQAPLLIADEPVANLDQRQAETALKEMIENHTNCILALHNINQAQHYCDRIIGITHGMITLDAPAGQLTPQDLTDVYKTLNAKQANS